MYIETLTSQPAEPKPVTPVEAISSAIKFLGERWTNANLPPPTFTVKEIAGTAGLPSLLVASIVADKTNGLPCELRDKSGNCVNGNMREAAIKIAPPKKVVRASRGHQNSFGNVAFFFGLPKLLIYP